MNATGGEPSLLVLSEIPTAASGADIRFSTRYRSIISGVSACSFIVVFRSLDTPFGSD